MAKVDPIRFDNEKKKAPSSFDEALLDEFFSMIASVAIRLTKDESPNKNRAEGQKAKGE